MSTEQTGIQWDSCPESYNKGYEHGWRCMRLEVPLDYDDPAAGHTTLAFVKKMSNLPKRYPKEMVVVLGGPGRSGVEDFLSGPAAGRVPSRHVLGRRHDIITFDSRGVGHSGPNIDCFDGDLAASYRAASGEYAFSSSARESIFEKAGAWGDLCKQNLNSSARYIGTAAVAQDILTYFERQKATAGPKSTYSSRVNFYGAGYGAVVGAIIASKYPWRVDRMVLDSPITAEAFYDTHRYVSADHNEATYQFFSQCFEAGPETCGFWAATPEDIEARYQRLLEKLEDQPLQLPFIKAPVDTPVQITADSVRAQLLRISYQGHIGFRGLSWQLADLEEDDYRTWDRKSLKAPSCTNCTLKDWDYLHEMLQNPVSKDWNQWAAYAISCSDLALRGNLTLEYFDQVMKASQLASPYAGIQSANLAYCSKWPFTPPPSHFFEGPFGGYLKYPLLTISNTHDPATPITYARSIQKQFPGSKRIEQEIVAHGAASWGDCTNGNVEDLFFTGRSQWFPRGMVKSCKPGIKNKTGVESSLPAKAA